MKILLVLTYYHPHVSGLTIYVQRLAKAMAQKGHEVTVLTARYDTALPPEETHEGVHVIRVPVAWRVSKGVIMPKFPLYAYRLARQHDVVSIHLPQFEAGLVAALGRLAGDKVVLTYHCDLLLPPGWFNRVVDRTVFVMNYIAGHFAHNIVAYTQDYANHSPFLSHFKDKIRVILPPVVMPPIDPAACARMKQDLHLDSHAVIGFAARFATEKGAEYLLKAIPYLLAEFPQVKVLFAGEYQHVIGEEEYFRRLQPLIQQYEEHITFLGVLNPAQMANFYALCDVLVLPSLNSTESFGLVQVEAMLSGTPVIASNLPGVRQPIRITGMGEITPIGDEQALARNILQVIKNKAAYVRPRAEIARLFDLAHTVARYEELFAG